MRKEEKLIKVFIADDETLVVEKLKEMLPPSEGFQYVGSANSGEEAIEKLKNKPVDIILMDQDFGEPGKLRGIEAGEVLCERFLKYPEKERPNIIFITKYNDYTIAAAAAQLKASIIGKSVSQERLIMYLKMIHEDGARIENPDPKAPPSPERTQGLGIAISSLLLIDNDEKQQEQLIEIACLIRKGFSSSQIQKELKYPDYTVENKKTIIFNRLRPLLSSGIINNAVLSALMERSGLCPPLELNDINEVLKEKT